MRARYVLLVLIVGCACWFRGSGAWSLFRILSNPDAAPAAPFGIAVATRSDLRSDQILAIDGRPLRSYRQFEDMVFGGEPGDRMTLVLSEPGGLAVEESVAIPSQRGNFSDGGKVAIALLRDLMVPLVCIFLGVFVVAKRPADGNAWLLLFLLLGIAETTARDFGAPDLVAEVWRQLMSGLLPLFMMLFGICFPERGSFEVKRPWFKYLLLVPAFAAPLISGAIYVTWVVDINAAVPYRPLYEQVRFLQVPIAIAAIGIYFLNVGFKSRTAASADSRRRLRILGWGSVISLAPALLLTANAPWPAEAFALAVLTIFPLTLAYAFVVERAMDLRFLVRRGLQFGIAKGVLWAIRVGLISAGFVWIRGKHRWGAVELSWLVGGVVVARQSVLTRVSQRLDRKIFRESYETERVLAELAQEAGALLEAGPLMESVASRISATMQVRDIVILLREDDAFVTRYSTRAGEPMNVAAAGNIAKTLHLKNAALEVYFDRPAPWIRGLTVEELQTLDFMRTQLLLPLMSCGELMGMMSLGAKVSEAPYSDTEIGLLETIASRMSLALENCS